jgi:putative Holliday junction resolvase
MRIGGLDVGDRRIGVAVSDELGWTAQGVTVVRRTTPTDDLTALAACLEPYAPTTIVVGLPRNMNGSEGPQAVKARAFAAEVERTLGVPVVLWDERLSTVAAERTLIEGNVRRAKRRQVIDKVAAVVILQTYLDSLGSGSPLPAPAALPVPDNAPRSGKRRPRGS